MKAAYFLTASLALAVFISHQADLSYQADINSLKTYANN